MRKGEFRLSALVVLVSLSSAFVAGHGWLSAAEVTLFSGGAADWQTRFGQFGGTDPASISFIAGAETINSHLIVACPPGTIQTLPAVHAEAQRLAVLGADFTYAADLTIVANAEAHLQFRISDQGRYGVRVASDGVVFYRFERTPEPCNCDDANAFTHCPNWPAGCTQGCDDPQYQVVASNNTPLAPGSRHQLSISAQASHFQVTLDGQNPFSGDVVEDTLRVGRFGVYAFAATEEDLEGVVFTNPRATTDPTQLSNFALLYSTSGYELTGTKRALVRTLNDLPASSYVPAPSKFSLTRCVPLLSRPSTGGCNGPVVTGPLTAVTGPVSRTPPAPGGSTLTKTFGMQLWEADFTKLATQEGDYSLSVSVGTKSGLRTLDSARFRVQSRLASSTMVKPLSIVNADARRAADEDMRRNWCFETATGCTNNPANRGAWSVALDGAFLADRADAAGGAVLRRVFNINNTPLVAADFRYVGQITIINGCDAQMQFRITPAERLAVTLQAEDGGQCPLLGGPGAVRLHREGPAVPKGFQTLATAPFPAAHPFEAGHPYDVDILARGGTVTVVIDGGLVRLDQIPVSSQAGVFGLKAFAGTARFERIQAWNPDVDLQLSPDGSRIGFYQDQVGSDVVTVACQDFVHALGSDHHPVDQNQEHNACYPFFSQLHGFHDSNNIIGEATSHGAFLAGLMEVWTARASGFTAEERESLRRAIQTTALYIEELYQQGDGTGEFAHSEMGRGGVDTNLGPHQTLLALYGESAFAADGAFVDRVLAHRACDHARLSADWLGEHGLFDDTTQQSVVYARLARCTGDDLYWNAAAIAANEVLDAYATPGFIAQLPRDTGRVYPWFEGVYELFRDPAQSHRLNDAPGRANWIADLLVHHLTQEHVCDDQPDGPRCPANGFFAIPQGSGNSLISFVNWWHMDGVPLANRPVFPPGVVDPQKLDFLHFYNIQGHFPAAVSDSIYLLRMADAAKKDDLEKVASGNYYWMFGVNPGVPSQKILGGIDQGPWRAASFVRNPDVASSRIFEGYRTNESSAKGWLGSWEGGAASPRRETWWVDPLNNGFQSTVNGHVLWDGQWDYWNVGNGGWASGETFLLGDGALLKAAVLYEDRQNPAPRANPYETTRLAFFDTTHVDRVDSLWAFDDPDHTLYAQASRSSTGFCDDKGFNGGRFTGHHIAEKDGLLCTPVSASFFDATDEEINATGWGFADINTAPWAQVARAATNFCNTRGYVGGFATGHQLNGLRGMICLGSDVAHWFDATPQDLFNSGEGFSDINTVAWAQAARAATNICLGKGFAGGFFTGHQLNGMHGVVCLQ